MSWKLFQEEHEQILRGIILHVFNNTEFYNAMEKVHTLPRMFWKKTETTCVFWKEHSPGGVLN